MLNTYLTRTQQLLQNPPAPTTLYSTADLTSYINVARGQLAGEGECIRFEASLPLVAGQRVYNFSSISLTGSTGIQGVINIRTIWRSVGDGRVFINPRSFEWFSLYHLNSVVPASGEPTDWSQYGQGVTGSIYVDPLPDVAYTMPLDCVCYPIALVDDTTPEAIPYLWSDAIPYFSAYLALLAAQSAARQADAQRMFDRYTMFVNRARRFATPSVQSFIYPQSPNPVVGNQLGYSAPGGGGQG